MEKLSKKLKLAAHCLLYFLLTLLAGFCWGRISYAHESASSQETVVPNSNGDLHLPGETEVRTLTIGEVNSKLLKIGELATYSAEYSVSESEEEVRNILDNIKIPGTKNSISIKCTGIVKVGDEVQIIGLGADGKKSVVTGVEMFRKLLDQGEAGDNVGLLLRGIDKNEIKRGMVICHPGQVKEHSKFKAEVYILKKEEGGRHTPFHNKYRPQFYIRTLDVTGEITLPEGTEMVMPGDNVTIEVELIYPVACSVGLRFAIREGGRTVGAGQITELEN